MKVQLNSAFIVGLAVAFAVGAGATFSVSAMSRTAEAGDSSVPPTASAVQTRFPDLVAATSEPTLDGLAAAKPQPGTVVRVKGPFDDRLTFEKLTFDGSRVSVVVRITSDVSEILDFQALAGFYDSQGKLLGTNRFTYHLVEGSHSHTGPPSELQSFTIAVPTRLRHLAVSAAVGVPVLVNE